MTRWSFDWPRAAQPTEGLDPKLKLGLMKTEHKQAWREHRCIQQLLADHYPMIWSAREWTERDTTGEAYQHGEGVRWCRNKATHAWHRKEDDLDVVELERCGKTPYCPACNDQAARKRGKKILDKLTAATPKNEDVTIQLVTLAVGDRTTSDATIVDAVKRDWKAFRAAAYRVLEWMYGEDVGAFLTYQEYGQRLLIRPRPHIHAIVHHWREQNGRAQRVPKYDLSHGGRAALDRRWFRELRNTFPHLEAQDLRDWIGSYDVDVRYVDHPGAIAKATKYVARELIDFRELRYDRGTQTITVHPYKNEEALGPVSAPVETIKANFTDYAIRCGHWGRRGRGLHAAYGNLSDGRISDTIHRIGRGEEHPEGCWCHQCSTWERFWEDAPKSAPLKAKP